MDYLSERVSVERGEGRLSVVIAARLPAAKRNLLVVWSIAWLLCGIYLFIARRDLAQDDPLRQYLLVFLAFWAYFMLKIGRATLWRLRGFEIHRVKDGRLTIKDSLFGLGRANHYFVDNIRKLGLIDIDRSSWKWQWNESPWVIGGERLGFEHLGKKVVFGKGLDDDEAKRLVLVLKDALKHQRKTAV
ncbi:MAG: hypothetical protein KIT10_00010 [Flavobacteriales bacterium]|nr:hypothetical protein [Flavobacteriales bacterium]